MRDEWDPGCRSVWYRHGTSQDPSNVILGAAVSFPRFPGRIGCGDHAAAAGGVGASFRSSRGCGRPVRCRWARTTARSPGSGSCSA